MKFRFTLLSKVLAVAFLNLLLLGVALLLARHESRIDLDSFLMAPEHDRILAATRLLALQLGESEPAGWDAVMARYTAANHVTPRLVDDQGRVLAGDRNPLPAPIVDRFLTGFQARPERTPGRGRSRGHHGEYDLALLGAVSGTAYVAAAAPLPGNAGLPRGRHAWIVLASTDDDLFFVDIKPWIAVGCTVILISLACWLPFVRSLTRSIKRMTAATSQVAEGHFEIQVPAQRRDELGELAASINRMASRLDRLVNGQKRFLRDAAHELRSPLARIQLALGLLDRSAAPAQQASLADLREDVEHMGSLVDGVLAFSRAPVHAAEPVIEDVPLAGLLAHVVEREGRGGVAIETALDDGLAVSADPELLFRAVSNVVRNAVRYAGAAGPIEIAAKAEREHVVLTIADCGPGVPASELEAIFDPFYRLHSARERSTGGVGLGLAIVKSSIEASKGTVLCRNRRPSGLEVEIRLQKATCPNIPDRPSPSAAPPSTAAPAEIR